MSVKAPDSRCIINNVCEISLSRQEIDEVCVKSRVLYEKIERNALKKLKPYTTIDVSSLNRNQIERLKYDIMKRGYIVGKCSQQFENLFFYSNYTVGRKTENKKIKIKVLLPLERPNTEAGIISIFNQYWILIEKVAKEIDETLGCEENAQKRIRFETRKISSSALKEIAAKVKSDLPFELVKVKSIKRPKQDPQSVKAPRPEEASFKRSVEAAASAKPVPDKSVFDLDLIFKATPSRK